jgi:Sec-independent protein translocase protein TatA
MEFLNLGLPEIIFIIIIAVILFGPNNIAKSAKEAGGFIRKAAKSPYWKEVWATKKDLDELPKMIARETQLTETIQELNRETRNISGSMTSAVKDLIKDTDQLDEEPKIDPLTSKHDLPQGD